MAGAPRIHCADFAPCRVGRTLERWAFARLPGDDPHIAEFLGAPCRDRSFLGPAANRGLIVRDGFVDAVALGGISTGRRRLGTLGAPASLRAYSLDVKDSDWLMSPQTDKLPKGQENGYKRTVCSSARPAKRSGRGTGKSYGCATTMGGAKCPTLWRGLAAYARKLRRLKLQAASLGIHTSARARGVW